MQITALQAQNRSGLHFCTFIIVRPLSHTRSSKLLCNLLHCELRIALDCIFALLSLSDHSHTPDLVNYYATYCIASSDHSHTPDLSSKLLCNLLHCELRIALDCIFALFIIFRPLSHTRSSKLLCNLLHCELRIALDCIFALLSSVRPLSHTRSSKLLCNLLHCELRIALDCIFALLSSVRPLSHTYATY